MSKQTRIEKLIRCVLEDAERNLIDVATQLKCSTTNMG